MNEERFKELEERVLDFSLLRLPGQPLFMHMGTSYLVSDLWNELKKLYQETHDASQAKVHKDEVTGSSEPIDIEHE